MVARVVFGLEDVLLGVTALSVMVESKFTPFADINDVLSRSSVSVRA